MLLARAIQMFVPGIPQVYYVGLLAGSNDLSFPQEEHRAINRHNYLPEEIHAAAERPVVQHLLSLLRFRNTCPAFNGPLEIGDTPDHQLRLTRRSGEDIAVLDAEPGKRRFTITYTENSTWQPLM